MEIAEGMLLFMIVWKQDKKMCTYALKHQGFKGLPPIPTSNITP